MVKKPKQKQKFAIPQFLGDVGALAGVCQEIVHLGALLDGVSLELKDEAPTETTSGKNLQQGPIHTPKELEEWLKKRIDRFQMALAEAKRMTQVKWAEKWEPLHDIPLKLQEKYDLIQRAESSEDKVNACHATGELFRNMANEIHKMIPDYAEWVRSIMASVSLEMPEAIPGKNLTAVSVDLAEYGRLSKIVHSVNGLGGKNPSATALSEFNKVIQDAIDSSVVTIITNKQKRGQLLCVDTGDGALLIFKSVIDAVRFSEALHNLAKETGKQALPDHRCDFRIGIATGPIQTSAGPIAKWRSSRIRLRACLRSRCEV
jgi:hypothetical protein